MNNVSEHQVRNFALSFCPFGYGDIQAAVFHAVEAGYDENWAADTVLQYAEDVYAGNLDKTDPVEAVLNAIYDLARTEIAEKCNGYDIMEQEGLYVSANYIDSRFSYSSFSRESLIESLAADNISIEDLSEPTRHFLGEIDITQDDINKLISGYLNAETE